MESLASPISGLIVGFLTGASLVAVIAVGLVALGGWNWGRPPIAAARTALRALLLLDDFAIACHAAAFDKPEFDEDDPEHYFMHTDEPIFALPADIDWSILGADLEEALIRMPNSTRNVSHALDHLQTQTSDEKYFEKRNSEYVRLGLAAFELADRIEREFGLSPLDRPAFFQPRQELLRERQRRRTSDLEDASIARAVFGSNVTSIFTARNAKKPER